MKNLILIIIVLLSYNCNAQLMITRMESSHGTVYNPVTGKIWMDRNLGASKVATSSTDTAAYGDLYQWGRAKDGHQLRTSGNTTVLSSTDAPSHSNFITSPSSPSDWRSPQNNGLWQGVNGVNNPCPPGFRIPTIAEWAAEVATWSSLNAAGAFASLLKLPLSGSRSGYDGTLSYTGTQERYWSSTIFGANALLLQVNSSSCSTNIYRVRAYGLSIRCIKDY